MAATSMDQDRLKRQAGVPNTGRKSKDHVLHFTLSWHPEEAADLSKGEMIRAANTVLHVMGAERRQALLVAHNDQPQPHVHVLVNRVDPRDGRILSSSFERLKASRWAEAYEKERGKIYCHERVLNNAARDRGEYTRGEKDVPRPVHEAAEAIADRELRKQLFEEHRQRARRLKEIGRQQQARHEAAWREHEAEQLRRQQQVDRAAKQTLAERLRTVRGEYRPRWEALHFDQLQEQQRYEERETRLLGRVQNALRSVDLRALVGRRAAGEEGRIETLRQAFQVLADSGARQQLFEQRQREASETLRREQAARERELRQRVDKARRAQIVRDRERAEWQRNELVLRQAMERAKLRTEWLQKRQELERRLRQAQHERATQEVREPAADDWAPPRSERGGGDREADRWDATRGGRDERER